MTGFMHKYLFLLFLITAVSCIPTLSTAQEEVISLNASKEAGRLPTLLNSNIWIQNLENLRGNSYLIDRFFEDNKPEVVQLSMYILQGTKSFEDFKETLKNYLETPAAVNLIRKAKDYDTLMIVGYDQCAMPEWLSSNPGNMRPYMKSGGLSIQVCSPPKDYILWGEVVKYTLKYFRSLGLNNLGFFIGHEPNQSWLGGEKSLYMYYEYAARAAKSVDKSIKTGGLGSWKLTAPKNRCDSKIYTDEVRKMCVKDSGWAEPDRDPFTKNFIEYIANKKVPIDFINWHSFGVPPVDFLNQAETVRKWLKENGLNDSIPLYPSDWTYWAWMYPADFLDTTESASYIISSLYYMWKAGIQWHGHDFDVIDYEGRDESVKKVRKNSTFIGDWSLFTRGGKVGGGIIKPMYNAFKLLTMLTDNKDTQKKLLEAESTQKESVAALSTITSDKKEISLLLTNFIPKNRKAFRAYILDNIEFQMNLEEEKNQLKACMVENTDSSRNNKELFMKCKDKVSHSTKEPKKIEAIDFVSTAYLCMKTKNDQNCIRKAYKNLKYPETKKVANWLLDIIKYRDKERNIKINVTNIPFEGKATLTTYRIDSTHSNACIFNKKTEPSQSDAPCGIGGAIDKAVWKAKDSAKEKGIKEASAYLFSIGYTNKEVELLKQVVEICKNRAGMKECLNKLIKRTGSKFTYPHEKIKGDLKDAFKRYNESYHASYYNSVDKINSWEEISLEGSEKVEIVNIEGNKYDLPLSVEPNSVWLIVLSKKDK